MPTRNRALVWISAGALAATILLGASSMRGAQDPPQPPTFRTEANYVRVDLFPTTRDGVPIADLRQDELQILEDGVPQKIEQFEHVVIRGNVPQEARREPATIAESRAMLQDARARVFVLFLDTLHVEQSASRTIRKPLVDMLERLLGPDDLVAVMTPQMSSSDITFARKTTILEGFLNRSWWGERDALIPSDPVEEQYKLCYPARRASTTSAIAKAMIDRRREKLTLDALGNLVGFLRDAREERKAIIAITDGWVLFRPDQRLTRQVDDRPPELPPINVDPRNGRLTTRDTTMTGAETRSECEQDRISLAQLDHQFQFTRLLDEANRANASFYPVDPRGLAVFDTPIGPDRPPTHSAGQRATPAAVGRAPRSGQQHRRHGGGGHQRHQRRAEARGRRPLVVLPARLLFDECEARWQVPIDLRPRAAPRCAGACAARLSGRDRGRGGAPYHGVAGVGQQRGRGGRRRGR